MLPNGSNISLGETWYNIFHNKIIIRVQVNTKQQIQVWKKCSYKNIITSELHYRGFWPAGKKFQFFYVGSACFKYFHASAKCELRPSNRQLRSSRAHDFHDPTSKISYTTADQFHSNESDAHNWAEWRCWEWKSVFACI